MFTTEYLVLCVWGGAGHGQSRRVVALILWLQVGMHISSSCLSLCGYKNLAHNTVFIVVVMHVEALTHSCSACPLTATKSKAVINWANKTWRTLWYKHFFAFWLLVVYHRLDSLSFNYHYVVANLWFSLFWRTQKMMFRCFSVIWTPLTF